MQISFIVNPVYLNDGWSPWDLRLGGSEECVVEWSKRLAMRHWVTVYHNGRHGEHKGVQYKDHSEYEPGDITINVNYPQWPVKGKTVYWSSLTDNPDTSKFDVVLGISEYAKQNTGLPERTILLPPGYDDTQIYTGKKIAKQCFYSSSPDRGLDILLEAWPKVYEEHPDATLIVTYGGEVDLPGVLNIGSVDERTMSEIYRTSDVWCHPCIGGELYCMTGKKAQVSGCIPVIIPIMALNETVERGFKVKDPKDYAQTLIEVLNMPMEARNTIRQDVIKHAHAVTWEESTKTLLEIINGVLSH